MACRGQQAINRKHSPNRRVTTVYLCVLSADDNLLAHSTTENEEQVFPISAASCWYTAHIDSRQLQPGTTLPNRNIVLEKKALQGGSHGIQSQSDILA